MWSESDDHANRPRRFAILSSTTKLAASFTLTVPGNISWIMADACPSTPIPAVTFTHSIVQRSQNCGVRTASRTVTPRGAGLVVSARCVIATDGVQSAGGTRTVNTPNIITTKYSADSVRNVAAMPLLAGVR